MRTSVLVWGAVCLSNSLGLCVIAQEVNCTSGVGNIEVQGNLNIAASCRLNGTEVRGNVTIFAGGSLVARDAQIFGNVEGNRGNFVDIDDSSIDGNVRLEEFVGDRSIIQRSNIRGGASLRRNRSRLEILNNDLDGGLQAVDNTGGLQISGNSFGGDLECSGNNPAPTGLGNRVDGNATGQCSTLESSTSPPAPTPTPTPNADADTHSDYSDAADDSTANDVHADADDSAGGSAGDGSTANEFDATARNAINTINAINAGYDACGRGWHRGFRLVGCASSTTARMASLREASSDERGGTIVGRSACALPSKIRCGMRRYHAAASCGHVRV